MTTNTVTWTIDIFDAESPHDAAVQALAAMQRIDPNDPCSASVFDVDGIAIDLSDPIK